MSKKGNLLLSVMLCVVPAALPAQSQGVAQPAAQNAVRENVVTGDASVLQGKNVASENNAAPTLREQLMPAGAALTVTKAAHPDSKQPAARPAAMAHRGASTAYMVAGAALFAAGIIAGGGAGTVLLLAGAGIGAYGLYLHFQ